MYMSYKKRIIYITILLTSLLLIISLVNIFMWKKESQEITKEINNLQNDFIFIEYEEPQEEIKEIPKKDKSNPYKDYITTTNIDFKELKKINNKTKGWLKVNSTNINYPFVQAKDNKYYLNHSFNKEYNSAGWVFLDYRNNFNKLDKNNIIYAHGRYDKTMFGTLKDIIKKEWYTNKKNHTITIYTENKISKWKVFSIYKIKTTNDYLKIYFTNKQFMEFQNMLLKRSIHNFNTKLNKEDIILTLSTCYNKNEKVVLHAKLIQ